MTQRARVVLAIIAVTFGIAAAATFLPSSAPHDGSDCGTWISPELTREHAGRLTAKAQRIRDDYATVGGDQAAIDSERAKIDAVILEVETMFRECDAALGARRSLAVGALVVGSLAGAGVLVAWPGKRRTAI